MSEVIFAEKKCGIAAGLEWRALREYAPKKPISNEVRELAKENEAERIIVHAVQSPSGIRASLGMYVQLDPDEKIPSELYSLAALLVHTFPNEPNLVLAWKMDTKTAVVVVQGGIPVVDEVKEHREASALAHKAMQGGFGVRGHRLFTNEAQWFSTFSRLETISLESLLEQKSNATRLTVMPFKPATLMAAVIVVFFLASAVVGVVQLNKAREKDRLRKEMAASDPVPPYLAALDENINRMGFARKDLIANIAAISKYPAWQDGWLLTKIECIPGQCISRWARVGGTTSELLAARSGEQMLPESTDDAVALTWNTGINFAGIGAQPKAIQREIAKLQNTNTFQKWRNAKLLVSESADDFRIWPVPTAGDVARLPKEIALFTRSVDATVPLPLVGEVIESAPPAVWFNAFTLSFAPGEKEKMFQVTLKGNTYVR